MIIEVLPHDFSVCQVKDYTGVDLSQDFVFTGKTDEEYSLVCPTDLVPLQTLKWEDGWVAMRVVGVLDFSLIGILADIASRLAQAEVSLFALSTYNTDYILIKKEKLEVAMHILGEKYEIQC